MGILEAIILGIVQGLTEFLPVSSSGHLIIAERIMGVENDSLAFELVMHLGTLSAVFFVYRTKIIAMIRQPFSQPSRLIIVATIPTVIIVFIFNTFFRSAFDGRYLIYCFLITAILLLVANRHPIASADRKLKGRGMGKIGYLDACIIGMTQGLAAFPGISRSGSTISVSMLLGNDRGESADFSLLLSIPIIIGSAIYELLQPKSLSGIGITPLILGYVASFVSGLIAIKLLLQLLKKLSLDAFAIYLFILSIFLLINNNFLFLF